MLKVKIKIGQSNTSTSGYLSARSLIQRTSIGESHRSAKTHKMLLEQARKNAKRIMLI